MGMGCLRVILTWGLMYYAVKSGSMFLGFLSLFVATVNVKLGETL